MPREFSLMGFVLGIPLLAVVVLQAVRTHHHSQFELHFFNIMTVIAVGAGAAGILLLVAIRRAGQNACNNREYLLRVFEPGLYITAGVLICLVIVHAGLAIVAISALARGAGKILIAIAVGAVIGVWAIAKNTFSLVRKVRTAVIGKTVSRSEAPSLWGGIERVAGQLGSLQPDHIVVGLDPNFFVTEAEVVCLSGTCTGRTLYCSLPLMRILSESEFCGIVGHELGHFKGLDTQFSQRFYPIYRGTTGALEQLQAVKEESGLRAIALLPAIAAFGYFLECFASAESKISRERELVADQEGMAVSGTQSLGSALVKVHAFAGIWSGLQNAVVAALRQGKVYVNASKTYYEAVSHYAKPEVLDGLLDSRVSHPTDSHPPLGERIENLGISLGGIRNDALTINPLQAAVELIPDPEKVEEEISGAYQEIMARQLGLASESSQEEMETSRGS